MKVHCHSEQFDGAMHATCGRVTSQPTGTKRIVNRNPVLNMIRESGHLVSEIEASDAKI